MVSVPYWGSLYFNYEKVLFNTKCVTFPSPIGVLYISMEDVDQLDYDETSFRPLLGFFIFQ